MLNDDSTRTTDKQREKPVTYYNIYCCAETEDPYNELTDKCFLYAVHFPLKSKDGYLIGENEQALNELIQMVQDDSKDETKLISRIIYGFYGGYSRQGIPGDEISKYLIKSNMDLIKKDPNVLFGITDGICSYFLEKGYFERAAFRDIFNSIGTIDWIDQYLISSIAKGISESYFTCDKKEKIDAFTCDKKEKIDAVTENVSTLTEIAKRCMPIPENNEQNIMAKKIMAREKIIFYQVVGGFTESCSEQGFSPQDISQQISEYFIKPNMHLIEENPRLLNKITEGFERGFISNKKYSQKEIDTEVSAMRKSFEELTKEHHKEQEIHTETNNHTSAPAESSAECTEEKESPKKKLSGLGCIGNADTMTQSVVGEIRTNPIQELIN